LGTGAASVRLPGHSGKRAVDFARFDDFSPDLAKAAFTVGNILPNLLAPTVLNLSPACLSHG